MLNSLPRRERDVFDALCSLKEATAASVREALPHPPLSGSAVRTLLARLEAKGLVTHRAVGQTYVYAPVPQPAQVAKGALQRLVDTFFGGSAVGAATALLGLAQNLKPDELAALERAIDEAKERDA